MRKKKPQTSLRHLRFIIWLPNKDSNLDKRCQRPVCYRYTIRQCVFQLTNYSKAISENQYGNLLFYRFQRRHRSDLGQFLSYFAHVFIDRHFVCRVSQSICRMVRRHDEITVLLNKTSPYIMHYGLCAEESLISRRTAEKDHLGPYEHELLSEKRLARSVSPQASGACSGAVCISRYCRYGSRHW